ncbi:MAG: DUF3667 domain-containing protein [Novosphingobium sp.]|nr:DUF3667 domain-containing protein [Novosphingobium sp.]
MGEIDAAADVVTGALIARAVEPKAGEGHDGSHDALCLNCGTALVGPHCHRCGQAAHVHRSLSGIGHDLLHGVFHFEGKLWHTLPMLAWRPGDLTRRYIQGERARFVSPIAIFLFSIFVMFAVYSWAGVTAPTDLTGGPGPATALQTAKKETTEKRDEARAELAKLPAGDQRRAKYEAKIASAQEDLKGIDGAIGALGTGIVVSQDEKIDTGWHTLDHGLEKWQKNPSLMLYKLQSSSYKYSWMLIVLSLPFVWLLFAWKRQYKLYDHAVFVTYSISFMSILFVTLLLLREVGLPGSLVSPLATVIPFVHITRQLKQAYSIGWVSAILRSLLLSLFIVIILSMFLLILLLMGTF